MATIPSFEKVLLEVHQSLGLGGFQSKIKNKLADLGYSMETQAEKTADIVAAVFQALDMDDDACRDAFSNIFEWAAFHKALEVNTWTWNASPRQVLWHLLAYSYAPGLGRRIAFWNLDGAFDKGMPGGNFWFLPVVDAATGKMQLPVPQVLDWLLDLLGRPMDEARDQLGGSRAEIDGNQDSIERNLYNWRKGNVPQAGKINEYFPDDAKIDFLGIFEPGRELPEAAQFTAALEFVRGIKRLSPASLRGQIPMTQPGRLEGIFDGSASEEEKQLFVDLVRTRYAKPSMRTIRQRLLVASMVQDGYRRLLKVLCPGVDELCTDPHKNKLLQVTAIFHLVYNLTVEAWKNCNTEAEENSWFESKLPPWDRNDMFLSILPSRRGRAYEELAALLSHRFATLSADATLEDLFALDQESARPIIERKLAYLHSEIDDTRRYENLVERVRHSSPWQTLQKERNYWLVNDIAQNESLSPKARQIAVQRMSELATNPDLVIHANLIELNGLLNVRRQERPKDVQQRVEALLTSARENEGFERWNGPLLQYEAKHLLAKNDFAGAAKLFRNALDACSDRNFGRMRGEIARDAFATEVANQKLIPGNHEKYYRNMLAYGIFEADALTVEDTAVWVADYFWSDLYKPYPGVERKRHLSATEAESYIQEALPLILNADWEGLKDWMSRHSKAFRKSPFREVRGNTVLMAWLKIHHAFDAVQPNQNALAPNLKSAIALLVENWPEQVNIADFKGQTPLMLVADAGDEVLVSAFLTAGADVNAQDYKGRTALHAATTRRSEQCVAALLGQSPDMRKATVPDKQTVLHTAVRMGQPNIVRMLLEHDSSLKFLENAYDQTPLTLGEEILADLQGFKTEMARHRRLIGSLADYEAIASLLLASRTNH